MSSSSDDYYEELAELSRRERKIPSDINLPLQGQINVLRKQLKVLEDKFNTSEIPNG